MTLFKNKYRVESTRLPGWDYSAAGYYYVTICTKGRITFLGGVEGEDVMLSPIGEVVAEEWLKTEQVRPNVRLDEWIIMPNHLHGIIVITHKIESAATPRVETPHVETPHRGVSTKYGGGGPVETFPVETFRRNVSTAPPSRLQPNSLGSVIGQFKSACTKRIWKAGFVEFGWQERFYDRIIQDEVSLQKARQYIANNPLKWDLDRDNPAGMYM